MERKQTPEWNALNRIWMNCSKEVKQTCREDFRLLGDMISEKYEKRDRVRDSEGYLASLSEEAKQFVRGHNPNLYHSMMAILGNRSFSSPEEFLIFYLNKYDSKRPYLKEKQELTAEVAGLCFKRFQSR